MMTEKAIFFDLGETLLLYGQVDVDALFRQGAERTYDYLRGRKGAGSGALPGFESYYRRHSCSIKWHVLLSRLTLREFDCMALLGRHLAKLGVRLEDEGLKELAWLWYEPLSELARIEDGIHGTLGRLQSMGYTLAVISNVFLPGFVLERQLARFELTDFFPVRIYSSDAIYRKPHRGIYRCGLDRVAVAPERSVMIGDKVVQDIRGARRMGMRAVLKRTDAHRQKEPGDGVPVIEHIAELPSVLEQLETEGG